MASFLEDITPFYGTGERNGKGQTLEEFLEEYGRSMREDLEKDQVDMRLDLLRFAALENDCDIAMYGHTHVPYLEEDPDDITILNPGSISKPRQADHRYTYMVMEIDDEDEVTYELRYVE